MKRWMLYRGSMHEKPEGKYILYMDYVEERFQRSDIQAAEAERDKLLDLLQDYGRHNPGCSGEFPPHRCKCGWDKARAALEEKP